MAAEDFAPSTPEEDDLFDFAEVEVQNDDYSADISTSSSDEEILEAVERAAAEVQELVPPPSAEPEEMEEDELLANFPEGTLDGGDEDLFAFDDLLSEDSAPKMDSSIVDDEDRYGMTAQEVAEHPDYSEEEIEEETSQEEIQPELTPEPTSAEAPASSQEVPTLENAQSDTDDFDFDEPDAALEEDSFGEFEIDRAAEAEEFASLLQEPGSSTEPEPTQDEIIPATAESAAVAEVDEEETDSGPSERLALSSVHRKPLYLLAGSFLALNLILAVLAIFAFFRVGSGLQGMQTSLAGSLETIAIEAQRAEIQDSKDQGDTEASTPTDSNAANATLGSPTKTAIELEPRERTEIRAARTEIAAGKFDVARRRLFQLLSVSDSPLSEEGRIAEEEANLLVAESFEAEARAHIEEQARLAEEAARGERP